MHVFVCIVGLDMVCADALESICCDVLHRCMRVLRCCADRAAPYSALAKKFVRKWLAGYAFDPERQVMRIYLSTLKPKPPKLEGRRRALPQQPPADVCCCSVRQGDASRPSQAAHHLMQDLPPVS